MGGGGGKKIIWGLRLKRKCKIQKVLGTLAHSDSLGADSVGSSAGGTLQRGGKRNQGGTRNETCSKGLSGSENRRGRGGGYVTGMGGGLPVWK